jgi:23S rRNA pseudouridine2604 synthase
MGFLAVIYRVPLGFPDFHLSADPGKRLRITKIAEILPHRNTCNGQFLRQSVISVRITLCCPPRAKSPELIPLPANPDNPEEKMRLSKVMAQRGLCSRREADAFIEKGWVKVNGEPVTVLGTKIIPDADIELDARALGQQQQAVTVLLHKPVGIVSGQPEKGYKAAISLINPENHEQKDRIHRFRRAHLAGLATAGRLDIESTGLLVLTQNGNIARKLIGPENDMEKEYLVRVEGDITDNTLKQLRHGLKLDGRPLKPAKVVQLNPDQLRFILKEGKKRQIRRMCEQVSLRVTGLKRVRIGRVRLTSLPEGRWRYLHQHEYF